MVKIYLKYCGGCNPDIDRGRIVIALEKLLTSEGIFYEYVNKKHLADIALLVNGCPHACKEEEWNLSPESLPMISVQGKRLRRKPVSEEQIPQVVFKEIIALTSG